MLLRAHIGSEKTACENSVPFPTYSVGGLVHSGVFGVSYVLLHTPSLPTSRFFTEGDDEDQEHQMIANLLSCSSPPIWVVAAPFRGSRETIRTIQRASQGYTPSGGRLASCCPALLCVCVVCVAVVCGVC